MKYEKYFSLVGQIAFFAGLFFGLLFVIFSKNQIGMIIAEVALVISLLGILVVIFNKMLKSTTENTDYSKQMLEIMKKQ